MIPGLGRSPGEGKGYPLQYSWASLVAQLIKNLPAVQETWVRSLGWEDPWRRERLATPVFWPGEFHGLYSPWGRKESGTTKRLSLSHKGFGIVNKAEIDVFLELSCFFSDPADVGNWISGSSAFSKTSLNIWKFTVHVLLKPGLENFEYLLACECNCAVV